MEVSFGVSSNLPLVKDNVIICTGAVVIGNITLEKGFTIGANAFVNK